VQENRRGLLWSEREQGLVVLLDFLLDKVIKNGSDYVGLCKMS